MKKLKRIFTNEHRKKISRRVKLYFSNEENRKKTSIATKYAMKNIKIRKKCVFWKGKTLSKKHVENMRKSRIGKKLKPRTKEHSKKISQSLKGRKLSNDHINKIKLNALKNPNYGMKNKRHTVEAKNLQGKSMRGRHHTLETCQSISKNGCGKHLGPFTVEHRNKIKIARSKQIFPKKDTSIEIKIQNYLKDLGLEFYTHQYMKEIEHTYQCDILIPIQNCINQKTIIECDGDYWHDYPNGNEKDHLRTKELIKQGFRVIRLWENEIKQISLEQFENKLELIKNEN